MRSEDEVRRVRDSLQRSDDPSVDEIADNFRYGMFIGKLIALGWVLNEESSGDLAINYDFEDWQRDVPDLRGQIPPVDED